LKPEENNIVQIYQGKWHFFSGSGGNGTFSCCRGEARACDFCYVTYCLSAHSSVTSM